MNRYYKNSILSAMLAATALSGLSACSSDDDAYTPLASPRPQVVVMYAPGGLGDQGYNDCILAGVQSFKKNFYGKADVYQYSPGSINEAERLLTDWLSLPESDVPALFVVASDDYEALTGMCLRRHPLSANKRILLFESDNEMGLPVTTFHLTMAGASYLAGVTAATYIDGLRQTGESKDALIVLAHPDDAVTAQAAASFSDGFYATTSAAKVDTEYLADDWTGYVSAQLAYQNMDRWSQSYSFVFPVAGGSNSGIYRYTREYADAPLTAGMDIDQSALSRNITGSVIKHIDSVVYNYLEAWLTDGELPESAVFGLESGYTDWQLSPFFTQYEPVVAAARDEAVRKEKSQL